MILTLLAVSLNDQALSRPITASFDATGGTIGRADHSTMALPDPERFISRKQAEIAFVGNGYTIRNVGAANPITVAQRTLAAGEAAPLRHGDEVRIGGYLLRAECRLDTAGTSPMSADVAATVVSSAQAPGLPVRGGPPPRAPLAPRPASAPSAAAPAAFSTSAPLAKDNPFADLFGPAAPGAPAAPVPLAPAAIDDDPFAGLMPGPAGLDPALGGVARSAPAAQPRLPDDFDPFATMDSAPRKAAGPAARPPVPAAAAGTAGPAFIPDDPVGATPSGAADDPFADLLGTGAGGVGAGTPSIDQAFGLGSADTGSDALARFLGDPAPASPAAGAGSAGGLPTDPLMLFGEDGAAASPNAGSGSGSGAMPAGRPGSPRAGDPPALPDHLPALHGAFAPPRVAAPQAPAAAALIPSTVVVQPTPAPVPRGEPPAAQATPAPRRAAARPPAAPATPGVTPARAQVPAAPPAAAARADTAALWRAFCEGAGVDLPAPAGEGEALMRHLGRVMRSAVEGTLQLIAVRASTKHEMRAAVTQIRSTMNNPLKFSPDAVSGLEQLLSPPQRGFMDGASAMDDAMLDLVGHSIGTVAGMRAAIEGMLGRFDPAALEAKLGAGSRLANLLPMNRKARLWELYLQHHRQIRDEAEEDFHTLFGRAFVAAYEQQVDRLEQEQRQRQRAARR
ncbi:MAG: type VI secretion system-associated FHA domain protein TagH [Rubrivivax sp.]|nr:type VI secretion system-associated FHA domain protein TagH [Rubrivivax sp.]